MLGFIIEGQVTRYSDNRSVHPGDALAPSAALDLSPSNHSPIFLWLSGGILSLAALICVMKGIDYALGCYFSRGSHQPIATADHNIPNPQPLLGDNHFVGDVFL
ncbi:hypothetical protein [Candidatus Tisiphia endosymbiont of Nemotelus uliginosus]|uniref:hypothetical protein n=1 Tax=Candidatus Tisiphia endosymbiont of Nemotelus uliginosus TaxID=3077926 RepID=UPI0035C8CB95